MRLILYFQETEKIPYTQDQLQGLVYSLIENAGYSHLHNLPPHYSRLFNFSQIFQSKRGLCLIITSPITALIESIRDYLRKCKELSLNGHYLALLDANLFYPKISHPLSLKTETPVLVRIKKEHYNMYGIKLEHDYPNFHWRPLVNGSTPFEPFIKQLEARVYKQYRLFTGQDVEEHPLFSSYQYIGTRDAPYFKDSQKISRIGTLWRLSLCDYLNQNLVSFMLDTGLGELGSQGYGFVSPIK